MHHVPIGAAAKGQIVLVREPNQVGKRIVLTVVKNLPDVADTDLRKSFFRQPAGSRQEQAHADRDHQRKYLSAESSEPDDGSPR